MKTVKQLFKGLGLIIGLYLAHFFYSLATAEGRVKPLCENIKAGTTVGQLEQISNDNGMTTTTGQGGYGVIVERRSFGRYGCILTFSSGVVTRAEYSYND